MERVTLDWAVENYAPDDGIERIGASRPCGRPTSPVCRRRISIRQNSIRSAMRAGRTPMRCECAGVPVRYVCHAGMIHHFYCMGGAISYAQRGHRRGGRGDRRRRWRSSERAARLSAERRTPCRRRCAVPDFDDIDEFGQYAWCPLIRE